MTEKNEPVKVSLAITEPRGDGTGLVLTTVEGINVEFLLDDMALAMLGITLRGAMKVALTRKPQSFAKLDPGAGS